MSKWKKLAGGADGNEGGDVRKQSQRPVTAYPTFNTERVRKNTRKQTFAPGVRGKKSMKPEEAPEVQPTIPQEPPKPKEPPRPVNKKRIVKAIIRFGEEERQHEKEERLQNVLEGRMFNTHPRPSIEDFGRQETRSSGTIRRYSQLPRERRLSGKYGNILDRNEPQRPTTVLGAPGHTSGANVEKSSTRQSVTSEEPMSKERLSINTQKLRYHHRKAEEEKLQDLTGPRLVRSLVAKTHFSEEEVRNLQRIYRIVCTDENGMDRSLFREVMMKQFGISGDIMLDQIYYYFDADKEGYISSTEWIMNLSVFLRGTFEEHTKFCYHIYDVKGDGAIGKNDILNLLQDSIPPDPEIEEELLDKEGNIRELADMLLRKFDREKKIYITQENFRSGVRRDPLSLQCLGQCLPDVKDVKTFLSLISENYNYYRTNYSLPKLGNYQYERDRFNAGVTEYRHVQRAFQKARTAVGLMRGILASRMGFKDQSQQMAASVMNVLRGEQLTL